MIFNCPGSDKFKQPQIEIIKCPRCCADVEIWSDEFEAVCPKCKNRASRQQGQSCLDWCKSARECVGDEVYNRYMKQKKHPSLPDM